ncbi:MAG: GGDEF domain-containing protein [Clostridia bacterium]|nr:GGDEF domain-containing protein [Clostridia bacterium]
MTEFLYLLLVIILLLLAVNGRLIYINRKLSDRIKENNDAKDLETLAFTDALTGVYNRNAYNMHIQDLQKFNNELDVGIMLFDIDNFKEINDTKGHLAGDEVLKFVAGSLNSIFPQPQNAVYRIGGDEFAVIAKDTTEQEVINSLINLRRLFDNKSDLRISNGYSIINKNAISAFKYADEMLYADKFSKK